MPWAVRMSPCPPRCPSPAAPRSGGPPPSASLLRACSERVKMATATLSLEGSSFCMALPGCPGAPGEPGAGGSRGTAGGRLGALPGASASPGAALAPARHCGVTGVPCSSQPFSARCFPLSRSQDRPAAAGRPAALASVREAQGNPARRRGGPEPPGRGSTGSTVGAAAGSLQAGLSGRLCESVGLQFDREEPAKDVLGFQGYFRQK